MLLIWVLAALFFHQPVLIDIAFPIADYTAGVRDTFHEKRNDREHEAIDILAPQGTPVRAVVTGVIQKLFLSKPGGNTIYEFDQTGVYCFYYAHLDRYAVEIREGTTVNRGQIIGYVGSTGNANVSTPHLHFAIFELGPEKRWWQGKAINPYPSLLVGERRKDATRH